MIEKMESNLRLEEIKKKVAQELTNINKQISSNISSSLDSIPAIKSRLNIPSNFPNKHLNSIETKVSETINKSIDVINRLFDNINNEKQSTSIDNILSKLFHNITVDKQSNDIKDEIEKNDKSVSTEMLESLHERINKQIEVETYSGNVVGDLIAIEKDYMIVGYTTLVPLQSIQRINVVEEEE